MELSGGQLQRIVIALALEFEPKLLLLDEPTTALDSTTKQHILSMIHSLQDSMKFEMLYVTHDLNSIDRVCEHVIVLKEGRIVEQGTTKEIIHHPKHAYTRQLIEANFANREFRV